MALDKLYLLERGKTGMLMDKIKSYSFDLPGAGEKASAADCKQPFHYRPLN